MHPAERSPVGGFILEQWRDGQVTKTETFFGSYEEAYFRISFLSIHQAICFVWTLREKGKKQ